METPKYMVYGDVVRITKNMHNYHNRIGGYLSEARSGGKVIGITSDYTNCGKDEFEYLGYDSNIVKKSDAKLNQHYYVLCGNDNFDTNQKYRLVDVDLSDDFSPFKFSYGDSFDNNKYFWARIISNHHEFSPNGCIVPIINTVTNAIELEDEETNFLAPQPKAIL